MKILKSIIVALLVVSQYTHAQDSKPLINNPSLSPSGQSIAFSYQGDIWTADIDGTNTRRITIHEGYESFPLWSKDGSQIVFESDRNGNSDIFVVSATGGLPKQLTYHSRGDYLSDVTAEGQVLFQSARNYVQIERASEIQTISITGGTPSRILDALGIRATQSPSGRYLAFTRGGCRVAREAYAGPASRDIWLYDSQTKEYTSLTTHDAQDYSPQWGATDETLYFLSARNGRYNVHQLKLNFADLSSNVLTQVTSFDQMGISSFQVGNKGNSIILNVGNEVHSLNPTTKALNEIEIKISTDYRFDPMVRKSYSGKIRNLAVSPNGAYSAIEIRGEIFVMENDTDKDKTVNVSNSSYRDTEPQWVNDSTLIFVSDRDGQNNIYSVQSADAKQGDIFKTLKHKVKRSTTATAVENNILVAPNGKSIAFERGSGKLITASISAKGMISAEKTLLDGWASPDAISWSPDSKWLAYGLSDLNFNDEIFIHKADNSIAPINISMHPKADYNPVWSADGSKLAFSSDRSNGDHDIWFLWLKKSDWEKTSEEWEYDDDASEGESMVVKAAKKKGKSKSDDDEKEAKTKDIEIDMDNIHERLVQVTSFAGNEVNPLFSKDGKTIYYSTTGLGWGRSAKVDKDIFKISWDGKDHKSVTSGNSSPGMMVMDAKQEYIYTILKGGRANRIKLASDKKEGLPISASLVVDYKEELNQIFEEAWTSVNENFYDPNFHGQSFDQLKAIYKPLALSASTREDFNVVFNNMLGQLNASHMGLYRGDMRKDLQKNSTGLIGVEVIPHTNGVEVIGKLSYMPADREISKIEIGEVITAVNGISVTADRNFHELMNHTAKERTLLSVTSKSGVARELEIRPVKRNGDATYKAWVKEKRALVDEWSNGELGYIHIEAMGWESFERFERELSAAGYGKKGIVIDVRYNGGGWTTDHLMAVLNVKQHAYTIPRGATESLDNNASFKEYYPYSERLPLPAWTKPSIALCNESSYSNAEIFSHAYKNLDIGTLVGQPTFGAVISTGGKGLIDGSYVRLPFRAWYAKQTGENMELGPAVPDILVENAPDEKGKNEDSQLKRAVEELLKEM